jgi:hypothetical protein
MSAVGAELVDRLGKRGHATILAGAVFVLKIGICREV